MVTIFLISMLYFSLVGFLNGFEFTWNLFKEEVKWYYKLLPSFSNAFIFSLIYTSIPLFSFILIDRLELIYILYKIFN
jgi:hypothetical protein